MPEGDLLAGYESHELFENYQQVRGLGKWMDKRNSLLQRGERILASRTAEQGCHLAGTRRIVHATPAFADNVLYIGSWDTHFYALNANTGQQLWRFQGGTVYFATSDSGLLHAVDAKSGADIFSLSTKWPMFSSPALAGNMLYIGSHEGKLFAIDISQRNVAWTFQTEGSKRNGSRYTKKDGSPDYEAAMPSSFYDDVVTGLHKMFTTGAILASPIVVNHAVYFGSTDGNVYALH